MKKQSLDEIIGLVKTIAKNQENGGFTIMGDGFPEEIKLGDYYEIDLTKSYVKFVKDIFVNQKYGLITENTIKSFGETIKTDKDKFKSSYQGNVKEIIKNSLYIHTTMTKEDMRVLIDEIAKSFGGWAIHITTEQNDFLDYYEAQELIKSYNIKKVKDWRDFSKTTMFPKNVPRNPDKAYYNRGWVSWNEWFNGLDENYLPF